MRVCLLSAHSLPNTIVVIAKSVSVYVKVAATQCLRNVVYVKLTLLHTTFGQHQISIVHLRPASGLAVSSLRSKMTGIFILMQLLESDRVAWAEWPRLTDRSEQNKQISSGKRSYMAHSNSDAFIFIVKTCGHLGCWPGRLLSA